MTIDPGAKQDVEAWTTFTASADIPDWISKAYIDSYRGPRDDSSEATKAAEASWLPASLLTPAMLGAHYRLGRHRAAGESCVAVYRADDPAGFGPALQVVAEHGGMLMDSVTVLLHRLGIAYAAILTPVFDVHRSPTGELLRIEPKAEGTSPHLGEAWMHVALSPAVDHKGLAEVERLLPKVAGRRPAGGHRRHSADRHPERAGGRSRIQCRRPIFRARPTRRRGTVALAG